LRVDGKWNQATQFGLFCVVVKQHISAIAEQIR
jgi:hypothetical protein